MTNEIVESVVEPLLSLLDDVLSIGLPRIDVICGNLILIVRYDPS